MNSRNKSNRLSSGKRAQMGLIAGLLAFLALGVLHLNAQQQAEPDVVGAGARVNSISATNGKSGGPGLVPSGSNAGTLQLTSILSGATKGTAGSRGAGAGMNDFAGSLTPSKGTSTIVGSGDLLAIAVFDVPEISGTFRVADDGTISFPFVGLLKVDGQHTVELEASLAIALKQKRLVLDPQVSVQLIEFTTQGVTVGGEVSRPGMYPILGGHTLSDAIAAAGGMTPAAGWIATVTRKANGKTEDIVIRTADGRATGGDVPVSPGDSVMLQRAGVVYVLGDVARPGGFVIDREHISVTQALALAQGFNRSASLGKSRIMRPKDGTWIEIAVNVRSILAAKANDPMLSNGDILYLPQNGTKATLLAGSNGLFGAVAAASIYAGAGRY